MPISNPAQAVMFSDSYDVVGEYVSDDQRIPYYNPADSAVIILPGEPLLVEWGTTGTSVKEVMMAQGPIRPGEFGYLIRYFTADFPADISANIPHGKQMYWDFTANVVSLEADVTNGFIIGNASYAIDPNNKNVAPTLDGNDRVICATTASTRIRIVSRSVATTIKGTVTALSLTGEGPILKKIVSESKSSE